jgi:hypothetical protein
MKYFGPMKIVFHDATLRLLGGEHRALASAQKRLDVTKARLGIALPAAQGCRLQKNGYDIRFVAIKQQS